MILDGVSIHANPGECIALTGPSGCGKSTLLNLLLRFETPHSGGIYFDGRDLSGLNIAAVRRQIGVVTQDGRIMSGSLFENICCGGANAMEDAWEAASAAGLAPISKRCLWGCILWLPRTGPISPGDNGSGFSLRGHSS